MMGVEHDSYLPTVTHDYNILVGYQYCWKCPVLLTILNPPGKALSPAAPHLSDPVIVQTMKYRTCAMDRYAPGSEFFHATRHRCSVHHSRSTNFDKPPRRHLRSVRTTHMRVGYRA